MQRGRGRGRGRNPNPTRSTSTRGSRSSTSRSFTSRPRSNRAAVRRSARIAELLNGELPPDTNGHFHQRATTSATTSSMADVARPRAVGNRSSVRSRHHSGNSRAPGHSIQPPRASASPEEIRYAMDIVLQPPPSARAGQSLNGSIIARLRTVDTEADDTVIADTINLYAVATLVPGPNSTSSTDPAVLNSLLAGRRFDSVHPFSDDEADGFIASMDMAEDPQGVGYMRFPELVIRQAGTYRIRITLIRIRTSTTDPSAAAAATGGGAGAHVQIVDSNPIVVQGNLAAYNGNHDDEDDGGWLDVLRTLQTRRRSR